jgi:hypothetical protein
LKVRVTLFSYIKREFLTTNRAKATSQTEN